MSSSCRAAPRSTSPGGSASAGWATWATTASNPGGSAVASPRSGSRSPRPTSCWRTSSRPAASREPSPTPSETPPWLFVELKEPTVAFHYRAAARPGRARGPRSWRPWIGRRARSPTGGSSASTGGASSSSDRRAPARRAPPSRRSSPASSRVPSSSSATTCSDAEAFRVVRAARADGAIAGLALGVHGGRETPPEISAAADVVLPTPRDAGRLLGALASALEREAAGVDAGRCRRSSLVHDLRLDPADRVAQPARRWGLAPADRGQVAQLAAEPPARCPPGGPRHGAGAAGRGAPRGAS